MNDYKSTNKNLVTQQSLNLNEKIDFDNYAEDYEKILANGLKYFGEDNSYFAEVKIQILLNNLTDSPGTILEYGCGIGRNFPYFIKYFPDTDLYGCDISVKSIEIASKLYPSVNFFKSEKYVDDKYINKFDLVFITNVLHHIIPEKRKKVLDKVRDMLKPNGLLIIFEHNPFNPLTRYVVKKCPFDFDTILLSSRELKKLIKLTGFVKLRSGYIIFFPSFLKIFRLFEKYMTQIPLGGQYYVVSRKSLL